MNRVLMKVLGTIVFAVAAFFFIVCTASMNVPQSMGGPMNMFSPSSEEWLYMALAIDAFVLFAAWVGIKLFGFRRRAIGMVGLLVGIIVLVLGVKNHIHAPPLDGVSETNMIPVPAFLHYVVYSIVGICLFAGTWLIARPSKNKIG